jgi:histone acetyltransferase (RNA polymerase elongator complex component)
MPQAGCPGRCAFCVQDKQTGRPGVTLRQTLDDMVRALEAKAGGPPLEVAFYGGTFTAMPEPWPDRFLEAAAVFRHAGVVNAVRCSTRPDAAHPDLLSRLAGMGLDMVELGVQTFDDAVLAAAGRGHTGQDVHDACRAVRGAGLGLGLQLLPGLPGHAQETFARDIRQCLDIRPDTVRLHPCLVLAGSGLEAPWRAGRFVPWSLPRAVQELARATRNLWRGGIVVSRIGLAPEPSLEAAVLSGPRHPALGTMVRGRALWLDIRDRLEKLRTAGGPDCPAGSWPARLAAPQRASGEFWGHARELEGDYAALGLAPGAVVFQEREDFMLEVFSR